MILLGVIFSFFLTAYEPSLLFHSDEAIFDGKEFTLKGKLVITHDLGKLEAKMGKTPHPTLLPITLYEDVELKLNNGFTLTGKNAILDHKKLTIEFTGDPLICNYKYQEKPLELKSKRAVISCNKESSLHNLSFSQIQKVEFFDDIFLELDKKVTLTSSRIVLARDMETHGFHMLSLGSSESPCMIRFAGNEISCPKIEADLGTQAFHLSQPQGFFKIPFQSEQKKITFDAEMMDVDLLTKTLHLVKHIDLIDKNIASLSTDEMSVILSDRYELSQLKTRGMNKVIFRNNRSSLQCDGSLILDLDHQTVSTEAEVDSYVFYQDPEITLSAQKGFFAYYLAKKTILPKAIELSGNIRFMINMIEKAQGYGVADRFYYLPSEKKLILAPEKDKRVLFWTDDETIKISAHEIHISEDPLSGEKRIEGKGDLRFTFTYDEEQTLFSTFKEKKS